MEQLMSAFVDPRLCECCVGNCESCHGDYICAALTQILEEIKDTVVFKKTFKFTLEYDRDEVERREKLYEEHPFDLFPCDMPEVRWTCSECKHQYGVKRDERGRAVP